MKLEMFLSEMSQVSDRKGKEKERGTSALFLFLEKKGEKKLISKR